MVRIEERGGIRLQEGNIFNKEQKPSTISGLMRRERDAYKRVLGVDIEVGQPNVAPEVLKNFEKARDVDLYYIPGVKLGTQDDLNTKGVKKFLKELEMRYPNWRRYEGLSSKEKENHSISRNLEERYWEWVKDGRVKFPNLEKGQWMVVENMPKPSSGEKYELSSDSDVLLYDRRRHGSWRRLTLDIKREDEDIRKSNYYFYGLENYSYAGKLQPKSGELRLRLLEPVEWNLLANREGWGKTDMYEWTNTVKPTIFGERDREESRKYNPKPYDDIVIVGSSKRGGAAGVDREHIEEFYHHDYKDIGFRVALLIP